MIFTLFGFFYFEYTPIKIMAVAFSFYVLNIIGNWMMLHRYFSHRSFEFKNTLIKNTFIVLSILTGRGSPLGWTYIHRQHHAYGDTDKDPHSPKVLGYKLFGFGHYKKMESEKMKLFLVKDLMTPEHLHIHKYYILYILSFILLLGFINIELLYFIWVVPATLVHLSQNTFNYFGHLYGYRNFDTKDDSRNNRWLFPLILGEAWHNNHHHNPGIATTQVKSHEIDPLNVIIKLVGERK